MPEKFKQALNMSISIPAWSLVSFLAGLVFYAGMTLNKLNTLLENFAKAELRVATIQEKQIERGSMLSNLQAQAQNHEARITALERIAIEKGK